jgi:hypothetical protein
MWFNLHTYRMGIAEYDPCYVTECLTLQTTAAARITGLCTATLSTSYVIIFNNHIDI